MELRVEPDSVDRFRDDVTRSRVVLLLLLDLVASGSLLVALLYDPVPR